MSDNSTLQAEKRDGTGKGVARKLRQNGRVPAVLYGGDEGSMHLSLNTREAEYLFHNISVDNTIIDLSVEGEKEPISTLVREIQTHPWKAHVMHVDFLRIQKGVAVDMTVPVHLVGVPVGVRTGGGIIEQIIHDIAIRCIPSKIPESIEVDISELDLNEVLHVADISFGEGVEVMIAQERTVCSIAQPRAEEVVEAPEEGDGEDEGASEEGGETEAEGDEG
jgi:large subunit ribosomal protein L25